jgi:hypothetical protein
MRKKESQTAQGWLDWQRTEARQWSQQIVPLKATFQAAPHA